MRRARPALHMGRPRWRLLAVAALVLAAPPAAVVWADPVKTDAKQFAKDVLIPMVVDTTEDEANTAEVPEFSATPPQATYADDPLQMEIDATAAKATHEGYQAMTDSMASRATFAPGDLAATIAPGKAVEADPATYTSGMTVDGQPAKCVALPQGPASPGFYEQSCNTGYAAAPPPTVQTCDIPLSVTITTEQHIFSSGITQLVFSSNPNCSILMGPYPQGTNVTYMGRTYYSTKGPGHVWKCMGTTYVDFAPHPVYVTYNTPVLPPVEDASACAALAANPTCSLDSEVCSDAAPATRTVAGVPVTLPCWGKRRQYTCAPAGPPAVATDCDQLDLLGCTFLREECLTADVPCQTLEQVYSCPLPAVPSSDKQICDGDIYCIDGKCDTLEREADTGFNDAIVALNAVAQAGREFDEATLTLFKGEALACTKLVFGVKNCCVPRGLPLIGGCSGEDTLLKTKREEGVCTYVGSWCSSSVLGVCLEKKERHCCYGSKITRIIQEQGRKQLGKVWAKPKDETCAGFTIEEFSQLDLSVMDFAEVYADFVEAASIPAEVDALEDIQAKIDAYYAAQGL